MSLREGCKDILKADCVALQQRLVSTQRRGLKLGLDSKCAICNNPIIANKPSNLMIFYCHHTYHQSCLRNNVSNQNEASNAAASNSSNSLPLMPPETLTNNQEKYCILCQNTQTKSKTSTSSTISKSSMPSPARKPQQTPRQLDQQPVPIKK